VTATEHSNLFCVYKNIIVCKVPVMKQHNRYSDTGKNATIIRVVNGLALSMVTVFEDIFHQKKMLHRNRLYLYDTIEY
jgi:hypothetical protein